MSDAECGKCGRVCELRENSEHTGYCDECAQELLTQWREVAGRLADELKRVQPLLGEVDYPITGVVIEAYNALAKSLPVPTSVDECFELCVKRIDGPRTYHIQCRLGLWSVAGGAKDDVEKEARNYWVQYYKDGEYADLLSKSLSDGGKG